MWTLDQSAKVLGTLEEKDVQRGSICAWMPAFAGMTRPAPSPYTPPNGHDSPTRFPEEAILFRSHRESLDPHRAWTRFREAREVAPRCLHGITVETRTHRHAFFMGPGSCCLAKRDCAAALAARDSLLDE